MITTITTALASTIPVSVPDSGITGFLLGLGILSLGLVARAIRNRKR